MGASKSLALGNVPLPVLSETAFALSLYAVIVLVDISAVIT